MIAAKAFDPVMGVDVHIIQPPGPVPPVPIPHPFVGMLVDPMDFAPVIGATVLVNGMPRATAGTGGKAIPPHIPIGGVFVKRSIGLTVAGLVRNIGYQASPFTDQREKLPLQVQLGTTYRFKHAPFRLGLMLEQLQQWDLTYEDPNAVVQIDPTTGETIEDKVTMAEKALLHVVPSAEILLGQNFMLRVAYNYRRRQEMVLPDKPAITGVSFGVGLRVKKIHVSYGYSQLHLAGISNTFTLAARFADFKRTGE